ncbi:sensor histidine kinase [Dermatophilus congolensis]|uniref:sensor histidine kinase n=1 Tax=Dermatophilus congolensis TaxID=1863 RepID=UPI001AAEFE1D|nr:histidine kinase [Dermatophilus congolensis]MBO3142962.1 hypothetical protein [Dermatophilus congolensis]MBO3151951.1 hypothetical protein [Dermatophilus congolensis]MBO3161041.1 hypothetical protein [Dermatophilus congolensis]MBO3163235.1 hypothetical protein [Dermatophilus congolensis]MBO3176792.1 hypothetical protein [Dermatophilus congolensis]
MTSLTERESWVQALLMLSMAALEGCAQAELFAVVAQQARQASGAGFAVVALPGEGGRLRMQAVDPSWDVAVGEGDFRSRVWGRILRHHDPVIFPQGEQGECPGELVQDLRSCIGVEGSTVLLVLPMFTAVRDVGLLVLGWPMSAGAPRGGVGQLSWFATWAARVIEAAREQQRRTCAHARQEVSRERQRIARDIHDHVIQRLFASGMSLQVAARAAGGATRTRLDDAVRDMEETVTLLREVVAGASLTPVAGEVKDELESLVRQAAAAGPFAPALVIEGHVEQIPMQLKSDVVAVAREGVTNMVRHARATDGSVTVRVNDEAVSVVIIDDGVGIADGGRRSGLDNLADRARSHGGAFIAHRRLEGGTLLHWWVPMR